MAMAAFFHQAILKSRPHLPLGAALAASAFAHISLVHYTHLPVNTKSGQPLSPLSVQLVTPQHRPSTAEKVLTPPRLTVKNVAPMQEQTVAHPVADQTPTSETLSTQHYLSPKEVEIQALPIVNVDLSMLTNHKNTLELQQSLPIQLRLYIDEFGRITQIKRIAMVLPQDDEMAKQLEALLKEVQFTPAKRAFNSVKSYQDVAFDFKANH